MRRLEWQSMWIWLAAWAVFWAAHAPGNAAAEIRVAYAFESDPEFVPPEVETKFSPDLLPLWMKGLDHPEAELRRQVAESIERAHRAGMTGLEQTTGRLIEMLADEKEHPLVKLAAAKALVALDARSAAEELWKQAQREGRRMTQVAEPALARWDYDPVKETWIRRLSDHETPRQYRKLAIRGLATVEETGAVGELLKLVGDDSVPPDIRLAAADALSVLQREGLEQTAAKLAQEKSSRRILHRLLAARLLAKHRGEQAESLLTALALDAEPAVAAAALDALLEIDPELVAVLAPQRLDNPDARVRRVTAESLVARPSAERIGWLAELLDDPHPDNRGYVRESLFELAAEEELKLEILQESMAMLGTERWRGLEQAALLLTALDHKPAGGRLVGLLEFDRPEVALTAAWGLRVLAIPETLPAMHARAKRIVKTAEAGEKRDFDQRTADWQLGHLFEAFGLMKYTPAEPIMRAHIPKNSGVGLASRTSGIWALGYLHEGKPDAELAKALEERLADVTSSPSEVESVRRSSAVALGRMKAKSAVETLNMFAGPSTWTGHACSWALLQITGEPIPERPVFSRYELNWKLEPVKRPEANGAGR